jgi:hypothetical protein
LVASPDQVQIYEPIMRDTEGNITYTSLRAAGYLKDNRLLPAGFDKAGAGAEIAVAGQALTDSNFVGGGDTIVYHVTTADRPRPYTVTARLLYQGVSYRVTQDLRRDSTPEIMRFAAYYDAAEKSPTVLATAQVVVEPGQVPDDIDGGGHVDVVDLLYMIDAFGSVAGDANYNAAADLNQDNAVNVVDLLMLVDYWDT